MIGVVGIIAGLLLLALDLIYNTGRTKIFLDIVLIAAGALYLVL